MIDEIKWMWSEGAFTTETSAGTLQKNSQAIGRIEGIETVLFMKEDIDEGEEDG